MTPHWIKISELDTELFYAVGDGKVFAKLYIGINDNYRIALRNDKAQFSQEIELTESDLVEVEEIINELEKYKNANDNNIIKPD